MTKHKHEIVEEGGWLATHSTPPLDQPLHLANKPQRTTSALFGLMYPMTAQRTINIIISGNHVIENDFRSWIK